MALQTGRGRGLMRVTVGLCKPEDASAPHSCCGANSRPLPLQPQPRPPGKPDPGPSQRKEMAEGADGKARGTVTVSAAGPSRRWGEGVSAGLRRLPPAHFPGQLPGGRVGARAAWKSPGLDRRGLRRCPPAQEPDS